jgi:hypothetical protein
MDQYFVYQYISYRICIIAEQGVAAQGDGADRIKKNNE